MRIYDEYCFPDAPSEYLLKCEYCGEFEDWYGTGSYLPMKNRLAAMKEVCPKCGRSTLDPIPKQIKVAIKSVTEMRWALTGEEADKAENILRELIDLADEVRCAV